LKLGEKEYRREKYNVPRNVSFEEKMHEIKRIGKGSKKALERNNISFNEAESIGKLVDEIKDAGYGEILVVDGYPS
jgi:hypothetical protein